MRNKVIAGAMVLLGSPVMLEGLILGGKVGADWSSSRGILSTRSPVKVWLHILVVNNLVIIVIRYSIYEYIIGRWWGVILQRRGRVRVTGGHSDLVGVNGLSRQDIYIYPVPVGSIR